MWHARVVCIDRDHMLEYVCKHVLSKYWHRVLCIKDDILCHTTFLCIRWPNGAAIEQEGI